MKSRALLLLRRVRVFVCGVASALVASHAGAALLPATGTYTIGIATFPPLVLDGTGSASSLGGPGATHTIPAGFFSAGPTGVSVVLTPTFTGFDHFTLPASLQNPAGSFGPNGSMPLLASAAFFNSGGTPAGAVPLTPVGGTGSIPFLLGPFAGTLVGATFQGAGAGGPLVFQHASAALAIPITVTATAYDNRTAGGQGRIQLVAPATGGLGIFGALPVFGIVEIEYTPEPGTWLLLAGGLAALAAGARRTRRR